MEGGREGGREGEQARTTQNGKTLVIRLMMPTVCVGRDHQAQPLDKIDDWVPLFGQHVRLPVSELT